MGLRVKTWAPLIVLTAGYAERPTAEPVAAAPTELSEGLATAASLVAMAVPSALILKMLCGHSSRFGDASCQIQ